MRAGWALLTPRQMEAADRATIEERGVPGAQLMEVAGRAVARLVARLHAPADGLVLVLCGGGNNGGDGHVVARVLQAWGYRCHLALLCEPARLRGDALLNWERATALGVPHSQVQDAASLPSGAALIVDALFGTGLSRPIGGLYRAVIEWCNASYAPVVSVDIPSGLQGLDGAVAGVAIEAAHTVTFGAAKRGHVLGEGRHHCGQLHLAEIGIPDDLLEAGPPELRLATAPELPHRARRSHKVHHGRVLLVAGSAATPGAAQLAAEASLYAGAGLVCLATPADGLAQLGGLRPEVMRLPLPGAALTLAHLTLLEERLAWADAVVLGPGLVGADPLAIEAVLTRSAAAVVDAEALILWQRNPALRHPRALLTPHPGEARRLLGHLPPDRLEAHRALVERTGASVLLKGAVTLTGGPNEPIRANPNGTPLLATGGSGDTLAGIAGALLARGLAPTEAGVAAAWLHAHAAHLAAAGQPLVLPADVARALPAAWAEAASDPLQRGEPRWLR